MAKVTTQIRLDENVYNKLKAVANIEVRSINNQMEFFIIKGIEQFQEEKGKELKTEE
jgi:hypothetical protein